MMRHPPEATRTDTRFPYRTLFRSPGALDCRGELLLPGLVDLHTDHCERHAVTRPGVHWDPLQAAIAHDPQVAAAGITPVFDSLVGGLRCADQIWEARSLGKECVITFRFGWLQYYENKQQNQIQT